MLARVFVHQLPSASSASFLPYTSSPSTFKMISPTCRSIPVSCTVLEIDQASVRVRVRACVRMRARAPACARADHAYACARVRRRAHAPITHAYLDFPALCRGGPRQQGLNRQACRLIGARRRAQANWAKQAAHCTAVHRATAHLHCRRQSVGNRPRSPPSPPPSVRRCPTTTSG